MEVKDSTVAMVCLQVLNSRPKRQRAAAAAAAAAFRTQKRKRTSGARPSKPSASHPEVPTPQPSRPAADIPQSTIPPELPPVFNVAPAPLQHDGPLKIHNRSVEEYQQLYHEVVDDLLKYNDGQARPYSLELGRHIKQKLWERLDRPLFTTSVAADGRVEVDVSYGVGVYPPLHDADTMGDPKPGKPPRKRAKKLK